MASSSSSSPLPENQDTSNNQITRQELFAFHNIDRQLFSRLVFNLRREPSEAMHIAAFWLWLERYNNTSRYVTKILAMQDQILEALVNETLICIRVSLEETDDVDQATASSIAIPVIQGVTGIKGISLVFFRENRALVVTGVSKIVQEVCLRAFEDIFQMLFTNRAGPLYNYYYQHEPANKAGGQSGQTNMVVNDNYSGGFMNSGLLAHHNSAQQRSFFGHNLGHVISVNNPSNVGGYGDVGRINNPVRNLNFEDEVVEMLGRVNLDNYRLQDGAVDDRVVPVSERTIFVTFSKGYSISEIELREFLSRSFGDIVEALQMQEVGEDEQPLYAKLVVPNLTAMDAVLGVHGKSKFSINGKHVWARKYVRKINSNSPPSSPPN